MVSSLPVEGSLIISLTLKSLIKVLVLWKKNTKTSCGTHFFCSTIGDNLRFGNAILKASVKMLKEFIYDNLISIRKS